MRKFEIKDAVGGAAFSVRIVTRAARVEFAGIQDDGVLKVRLTSSPSDTEAVNSELVGFLAELLGVEVDALEIVAGLSSREKLISVEGINPAQLEALISSDSGS
ncbi:DUF167 domain-containing protein [Chloroflexota bacterium]